MSEPKLVEWQPIETAPRDGTYIILAGPSGCGTTPLRAEVCHYDAKYRPLQPWINHSGDSFLDGGEAPTCWIPLPPPGASTKTREALMPLDVVVVHYLGIEDSEDDPYWWERGPLRPATLCCDTFWRAMQSRTDNEGYGALISYDDGTFNMGCDLPKISVCPWCGGVPRGPENASGA